MPLPILCCFCVLEKLHKKYSQNWTKRKPKSLFTCKENEVQRRDRARPGGGRTKGWRGPPPAAPPGGVGPWSTPWHCPSTYKCGVPGLPIRNTSYAYNSRSHDQCVMNPHIWVDNRIASSITVPNNIHIIGHMTKSDIATQGKSTTKQWIPSSIDDPCHAYYPTCNWLGDIPSSHRHPRNPHHHSHNHLHNLTKLIARDKAVSTFELYSQTI
jgi:hypothetical protein